jgi:hypothetical protein
MRAKETVSYCVQSENELTYYFMPCAKHPPVHDQKGRAKLNTTKLIRKKGKAHAKEKLSTFCTAAIGVPFNVMFVNGVLLNVVFPYQLIDEIAAWTPTQLHLVDTNVSPIW